MSEHSRRSPGPGHETRDVQAGPTFRAGLYILGAMFLTAAVVVPLFRLLKSDETAAQAPAATALKVDRGQLVPAGPRLLTAEPKTLADFRRQEQEILTTYAWVEKDKGIVRIPVDEAMRIVAERGLPTFPAPTATSAPTPGGRK